MEGPLPWGQGLESLWTHPSQKNMTLYVEMVDRAIVTYYFLPLWIFTYFKKGYLYFSSWFKLVMIIYFHCQLKTIADSQHHGHRLKSNIHRTGAKGCLDRTSVIMLHDYNCMFGRNSMTMLCCFYRIRDGCKVSQVPTPHFAWTSMQIRLLLIYMCGRWKINE